MSMEYADAVALDFDGSIRFGVIAEIVETTDAKGTRKTYAVDYFKTGENPSRITLAEEDIVEIPARSYAGYRDLDKFVADSEGYKWAVAESEARKQAVRDAEEAERRKFAAEREAARALEAEKAAAPIPAEAADRLATEPL